MKNAKTYLDLVKEHAEFNGFLNESDFELIEFLHDATADVEQFAYQRGLAKKWVQTLIFRLGCTLHSTIDSLGLYYIKLRKKEFELTARERRIVEREKELKIEAEAKTKYHNDFYQPIKDWGLSIRATNIIRYTGVETMAEFLEKIPTAKEFLKIRNSGKKSMVEICIALEKYGIKY